MVQGLCPFFIINSWQTNTLKCCAGKTSIIRAISNVYKMHIYALRLNQIDNDEVLAKLFGSIPSKSIVILEDIDATCKAVLARQADAANEAQNDPHQYRERDRPQLTLSGILNIIDGVAGQH